MDNPIIKTRFNPPYSNPKLIHREITRELTNSLDENRITLLCAPAGCGKTVLMTQAYNSILDDSKCWYSVEETDNSPETFLNCLINSLANKFADIPSYKLIKELYNKKEVDKGCIIYCKQFISILEAASDRKIIVFIDDYQLIQNYNDVNKVFSYLLERLPLNIHFCISSRQRLPYEIYRLTFKGYINIFDYKRLSFKHSEIKNLFSTRYNIELTNSLLEKVLEETGGWAAGLHLIGSRYSEIDECTALDSDDINQYIENEFFSKLDEKNKLYLVKTSIFPEISEAICHSFLGAHESDEFFNWLSNEVFYSYRFAGEYRFFNYHNYMTGYLRRKFAAVLSQDEIMLYYCDVFNTLAAEPDMGKSIYIKMLGAGNKINAYEYMAYVYLALALIELTDTKYENIRELFEKALKLFNKTNNIKMTLIVILEQAILNMHLTKNMKLFLYKAEEAFQKYGSFSSTGIFEEIVFSLMGIIYREAGSYIKAEKYFLKSADLSNINKSYQVLAGTYLNLAKLYLDKKEFSNAENYLKTGFEICEVFNCIPFWNWHQNAIRECCLYAYEFGINCYYVEQMLKKRVGSNLFEEFAQRLTGAKSENIVRILSIMSSDARSMNLINYYNEYGSPMLSYEAGKILETLDKRSDENCVEISMMGAFAISVFGKQIDDSAWKTKKSKALLKYLLLSRTRVHKEKLFEILWPDSDKDNIANSFKVALSNLRKAIGQEIVMYKGNLIWINEDVKVHIDFKQYEEFIKNGRLYLEKGVLEPAIAEFIAALKIYKGEFMADEPYEEAYIFEREKYHKLQQDVYLSIFEICLKTGKYELGVHFCKKAIAFDKLFEETYRMLIKLELLLGKSIDAIKTYKKCRDTLICELGIEPDEELKQFYRKAMKELNNKKDTKKRGSNAV